jgi:hypothetical protein
MIATDSDGDSFVAVGTSSTIYECTAAGQLIEIKSDMDIGRVNAVAVDTSGNLYATSLKFELYKLTPPSKNR